VNVLAVWIALTISIVLLLATGGSTGFDEGSPRGAPWTPPGAVIGAVWTLLYTLMGLALWAINHISSKHRWRARGFVLALIGFCLVWPFYAFGTSSRWPGLLGNLGILALAVLAVIQLLPSSRLAASLVAPVAIWITIATATILDGAIRYGW
jgi:tryptophan-rich sensory protein